MSLNVKVLGQGTIGGASAATAELLNSYPFSNSPTNTENAVPGGKAVIVKAIRFVSGSSRTVTVNFHPGTGATSRAVSPKNMALPANSLIILDDELTMEAGYRLSASVSAGAGTADVDFVVSGVERDQT